MSRHDQAEARSLRYHQLIAARLLAGEVSLLSARERVARWQREQRVHHHYVDAWRALLDAPLDDVCVRLIAADDDAVAMRQVSPFAGYLTARERWGLWRGEVVPVAP